MQIISNVKNAFDNIFYNQFNNLPDLESKCKYKCALKEKTQFIQ